jgi:LemA protein
MIAVYIIIGIVIILVIIFIVIYNRLVNMHNQMKNLWAQVDVQLKRRYDLIPNLVETVKGYAAHERGTLEAVTNARNLAQSASGAGAVARARAEGELSGALARLLVVAENYPNLKANENFLALQQQLATTENNISTARQRYNDMVMMCNNLNQQFPSNIVARTFRFHDGEFFEVKGTEERAAPQVTFP